MRRSYTLTIDFLVSACAGSLPSSRTEGRGPSSSLPTDETRLRRVTSVACRVPALLGCPGVI